MLCAPVLRQEFGFKAAVAWESLRFPVEGIEHGRPATGYQVP